MRHEVITFGSAAVDMFAETSKEKSVRICHEDDCEELVAFPSGEKILLDDIREEVGGGGANTAVCLARLEIPVAFGGAIGYDVNGQKITKHLDERNIDFVGHMTDVKTNVSMILDSKELHDRTILIYKGSSNELDTSQLDFSKLDSTWYYFSSLVGSSYKAMLELMRHARANSIAIAFNPSSYQTQQGLDFLREPISLANLLVMNKEEAEQLVGEGSREELCQRLRHNEGEIVLITDGRRGATVLYGDKLYSVYPNNVEPLETTGAGDCFASTFLAGLVMHMEIPDCLRLAQINAENLIKHVGAQNGLLSKEEAMRLLSEDNRHIEETNI